MFGSTKFWMLCCHHHHPHKLPEGQSKLWLFPQTQKENYYLQWQLWVQHCRGELLQGAEEKSLLTGLPGLHSKSQRCLLWPLSLVEMMEITESLNDWGWQGSLEVSLCNPLLKQGHLEQVTPVRSESYSWLEKSLSFQPALLTLEHEETSIRNSPNFY